MSLETALRACRSSWDRSQYEGRRVFGRCESEEPQETIKGDTEEENIYRSAVADGSIWQWEEETIDKNGRKVKKIVISSAKDNRRRVAKQHFQRQYKRSKEPIDYIIPESVKLTKKEKWLCDIILTKEHVKLATGMVRYANGYPMDMKGVAKLAGIPYDTIKRHIRSLLNKGIMIRKERNGKNILYVNKKLYQKKQFPLSLQVQDKKQGWWDYLS